MAFIKLFKFEESSGLLKKEYEKGLRRAGRIWNVLTIQSQTCLLYTSDAADE